MQAALKAGRVRGFRSYYTKGEEIFSAVSHIAGGGLGLVFLLTLSLLAKDALSRVSVVVFGLSVILLYTMSALYHFLPSGTAKGVFRIFDHCTIFLLIAGSYTPYCLIPLRGTLVGEAVLIAQWLLSAAGIALNAVALDKRPVKVLSMALYVAMGWMAIAFLPPLLPLVSPPCFFLLLAGGVAYTAGIAFFAFGKRVRYFHSVWHLFVLLGTMLQFASILLLL